MPVRTLSLVIIWAGLAAKSSVLFRDTVNTSDLVEFRADGCDSIEDIEWVVTLLQLRSRG